MQPTFRFSPMDEALVRVEENGKPVVYIGKILDSRTTDEGEGQYLVHYLGWNEIWDAWVFAKQIYELTEEALEDARDRGILAKQARGRIKNRAQNKTATTTTTTTTVATTSTTATSTLTTSNAEKEEKGEENEDEGNHLNNLRVSPRPARERTSTRKDLKRKREVDTGFDEEYNTSENMIILLTPALNGLLVQDAKQIQLGKLHSLPSTPSITTIMENYLAQNSEKHFPEPILAILKDLCHLFNFMVGLHLFYSQERKQYHQVLKKFCGGGRSSGSGGAGATGGEGKNGQQLCDIYGGIFLLRLFIKLPIIMSKTPSLTPSAVENIRTACLGVVDYLDSNISFFFEDTYNDAQQEDKEKELSN
eukprot:TRINITY_DN11988_c0_g1_i1.p1 TRINITY_DN11988_c0_g1~~TRINITY_DN11988_c0_g1_i1.p1  ORF type:complete len:363 (-),score=77.64 TRINITY_DN11988_c0_g1_i1:277-1365(-)